MKMKLKSWHLYVLATLCFLFAFTSLNMKYDRFYRVNGIDNDNRSLIEKYLDKEEQEATYIMRKAFNGMKSDEAVENILNMFVRTKNNHEFVELVKKRKFF